MLSMQNSNQIGIFSVIGILAISAASVAQSQDAGASHCASITNAENRLECYDLLAGQQNNEVEAKAGQAKLQEATVLVDQMKFSQAEAVLKEVILDLSHNEIYALEQMVLAKVRPIPASDAMKNHDGYRLLSMLNPDQSRYRTKMAGYAAKLESVASEPFFSGLRLEIEEGTGNRIYYDATDPTFVGARSRLSLVIVVPRQSRPRLVLRTIYTADSWLFAKRVDAIIDGASTPLTHGDFLRDNRSSIWEWRSESPTTAQMHILERIRKSDEDILRFTGSEFYSDRRLQQRDKLALLRVLEAFQAFEDARLMEKAADEEKLEKFVPEVFNGGPVSGKPFRCYDPKREIVYSFSPYTLTKCNVGDYHISEDDFQLSIKLKNK